VSRAEPPGAVALQRHADPGTHHGGHPRHRQLKHPVQVTTLTA